MAKAQYRGISFPFKKKNGQLPAFALNEEVIENNLVQIILTKKGTRPYRPEVGTNLLNYIFENTDSIKMEMLKVELMTDIAIQEPRVQIKNILMALQGTTLILTILYFIIGLNRDKKLEITVPVA